MDELKKRAKIFTDWVPRDAIDELFCQIGRALLTEVDSQNGRSVAIPKNADQAALMVLLGESWLRQHAPERLKPSAPAMPDGVVLQYYFKVSGCTEENARKPNCICWHDWGTGPLAKDPHWIKSWRIKPTSPDTDHGGVEVARPFRFLAP